MHPEVDQLRPKLKEILYDCAVEIRATKAALFLFDGANRYELVAEYGFRDAIRRTIERHDVLIDRCMRTRTAFFVNGIASEPRLSDLLFESSSDRLLAVPLFLRGQLVGVIDMRDKAAQQPFVKEDLAKAHAIGDRILELFAPRNVFGQRFISLSEPVEIGAPPVERPQPDRPVAPMGATTQVAAPPPAPRPVAKKEVRTHPVASLATLVIEARAAAERIAAAPEPPSMTSEEFDAAREVLRSLLLIPGVAIASFSAFEHLGGVQEVAGRSTLTSEATNFIQSKLNVWLRRRGEAGGALEVITSTPLGNSGPPVRVADIQKVFTAAVSPATFRGLYLTVGFSEEPDRAAHELLASLHAQMQLVIESAVQQRMLVMTRSAVAAKLLEPDFAKFPELRRHAQEVARLTESFARYLAMSPAEVESARLLGIVHDCGMRLLDYERLYCKSDLTEEDMAFLREHPTVGAALVEPVLGAELARAVLCHHERVDGRGYPNGIEGDAIPLLSKVVQICDAFVAMTDRMSYQAQVSPDVAFVSIERGAGNQFDAELAARFVEMMRAAP